uniref:Uncharacterized protein n=1 Tax=Pristionchus pacificus TaxID=54126 RepID=A0A2A6CRB8_PRIPA|eukprot:PDM80762.1 hypothetical protein PRIPAC_35765 [Pristionchus pacificus]
MTVGGVTTVIGGAAGVQSIQQGSEAFVNITGRRFTPVNRNSDLSPSFLENPVKYIPRKIGN